MLVDSSSYGVACRWGGQNRRERDVQAPPASVSVIPSRLVGFSWKLKMTTASTIVKTCLTLAASRARNKSMTGLATRWSRR